MNLQRHANRVPFAFGGRTLARLHLSLAKKRQFVACMRVCEESLRDMLLEASSEIEIRNRLIRALRDAKPVAAKVNR